MEVGRSGVKREGREGGCQRKGSTKTEKWGVGGAGRCMREDIKRVRT